MSVFIYRKYGFLISCRLWLKHWLQLLNLHNIEENNHIKRLGIYIDNNLNWAPHIQHINNKISQNLGFLFRLRHFLTSNTLKQIYYSLIYPYLHYGIMTWGNTYPGRLTKVQTKQNKCICCISLAIVEKVHVVHPTSTLTFLNSESPCYSQNLTKFSKYPWSVSKLPRKGVWYSLIQYQICLKS